jgi:HAD superfamily hydrolase (TIGR01549 family)
LEVLGRLRGVLFDLGATLLEYRREEVMLALLAEQGFDVRISDVLRAYDAVEPAWTKRYWIEVPENQRSIDTALLQLDKMLLERLRLKGDLESLARFVQQNWDRKDHELPQAQVRRAYPDARPCLEKIQSRELKMGIVSNIQSEERLRTELEAIGLLDFFPALVASGTVGLEKPQREIFEIGARKIGLEPREIMFVGDDLERDYKGAMGAGMDPVLVDRNRQHVDQPRLKRVTSLEEIPELLESDG